MAENRHGVKDTSGVYITLPSDASIIEFPNNTMTQYTVRLNPPLTFETPKAVALVECFIPQTWAFLEGEEATIHMQIRLNDGKRKAKLGRQFYLKPGMYENVEYLCKALNQALIAPFAGIFLFTYDAGIKRMHIKFPNSIQKKRFFTLVTNESADKDYKYKEQDWIFYLKLGSVVSRMLGFQTLSDPNKRVDFTESTLANFPPEDSGLAFIYIYSDLVTESPVGGIRTQLVRIIPTGSLNRGLMITERFHNPFYIPLMRNSIDTIAVTLRNFLGEKVSFAPSATARVVLVFHIKDV